MPQALSNSWAGFDPTGNARIINQLKRCFCIPWDMPSEIPDAFRGNHHGGIRIGEIASTYGYITDRTKKKRFMQVLAVKQANDFPALFTERKIIY